MAFKLTFENSSSIEQDYIKDTADPYPVHTLLQKTLNSFKIMH